MLIHPRGGHGTGVEAEGSNYPFISPSVDVQGLLADLWVAHEVRNVVPPLRVAKMNNFQAAFDGLSSRADILIVDAMGTTIYDSPAYGYYWKDWGPRLRVHEWYSPVAICRAVQHRATEEPHAPWPAEVSPANGVLDERTSELLPERLMLLSEKSSGRTAGGAVIFANGWNVDITPAPYREPLRSSTTLTFKADPGGGLGRYPGCADPETVIRKIGGVGPDERGNFTLAADGCYYARQPVVVAGGRATPTPATLMLGNDCDPCCDCDSFVDVQRAVLKVESRMRAAASIAEATRDAYVAAIERWNAGKECRESQAVTVVAATSSRLYADVNATICNVTDKCLVDMVLRLTVNTTPRGTWSVVPGTTFISKPNQSVMAPYQLSGPTNRTVTAFFDAINPRSAGRLRTRLAWTAQQPEGTMLSVAGVAISSDPGVVQFPQGNTFTTLMT